jgi:alpha-L-fucosidase
MSNKLKSLILSNTLISFVATQGFVAAEPAAPQPSEPVPSTQQLKWHEMEFYGLIHFGINTFANREWGLGDESPELFNPTAFDSEQIVSSAKAAGMRGLILVCKHHDGFCLWPSKYTEHSVKHSPWKKGSGDVVKEVSEACGRKGQATGWFWEASPRSSEKWLR